MKRISFNLMGVLCILFSTCFYACSEKRTLNSDYEIIPKPLDVNCKGDASFLLKDGVAVIYPENNQKMQDNAEFLVDYVEKTDRSKADFPCWYAGRWSDLPDS